MEYPRNVFDAYETDRPRREAQQHKELMAVQKEAADAARRSADLAQKADDRAKVAEERATSAEGRAQRAEWREKHVHIPVAILGALVGAVGVVAVFTAR